MDDPDHKPPPIFNAHFTRCSVHLGPYNPPIAEKSEIPNGGREMLDRRMVCESSEEWRDDAVDIALEAERGGGGGFYSLLREIRRECPSRTTIEATIEDIFRTMRFLETETEEVRELLPGSHLAFVDFDGGTLRPSLAWWAVRWSGADIEVVLFPNKGRFGNIIVISHDERGAEAFLRAVSDYARRPSGRCMIHASGWSDAPGLEADISATAWSDLVLEETLLSDIRDSVEGFARNREAFSALGFPWRRGILLVGPPGTGKTMVVKAVAASLGDMPFLYVRNLRPGRPGEPIHEIFERARLLSPAILAFEDVDGMISDANRSVFLNELDGLEKNEGLLVIASSNHPERIDPALLNRPSRFDRLFHLGPPALAERRRYVSLLLEKCRASGMLEGGLDAEALASEAAEKSSGFTPAHLKEVVLSAALGSAQNGEAVLGETFALEIVRQSGEARRHMKKASSPDKLTDGRGLPPGFRASGVEA